MQTFSVFPVCSDLPASDRDERLDGVTALCFIELVHVTVIQPSGTHLVHSKEQPVPQQLEKPEAEMRCWAVMVDKS